MTVVAIVGWTMWSAHQNAWRNATIASENLAMTIARAVENSLVFYDHALSETARAVSSLEQDAAAADRTRQDLLDTLPVRPDVGVIAIADARGRIVASTNAALVSSIPLTEQAFFTTRGETSDRGLEVSKPFKLNREGTWSIAVSRHLFRAEGLSGGIVVRVLPISYFTDLTNTLNVGHRGTVSLLRQDGIVISRTPFDERDIGQDLRSSPLFQQIGLTRQGGLEGRPRRDGVNRLFSYSKVGALPLVVTVGTSTDEIFADWWRQAAIIGGVTLALVTTLGLGTLALNRELTRRLAAEDAACDSAARYRLLAENSSDIILRLDREGLQRYVSPSVTEFLGYEPSTLVGQDWRRFAEPDDRPALDAALDTLRRGGERATVQYRCRDRAGNVLWVEASLRLVRDAPNGSPNLPARSAKSGCLRGSNGAIVNIRDVTWRKRAEDDLAIAVGKLAILATTDGLTALANRRSFDETLQREWRRARREMSHLSLLLLDADWFKAYNDRYGHQKGDEALRTISACIADTIKRPGDIGARYGGEEFAVVLPGSGASGAATIAEDIRASLAERAVPHGGTPTGLLTVSIGIASLIVQDDGDPADLLAAADAALYAAKRGGRDRVVTTTIPLRAFAAD